MVTARSTSQVNAEGSPGGVQQSALSSDQVIADLRSRKFPRLFVISGPSGVGKDAIIAELRFAFPDVHIAVTATTRPRRPGEADGVDYYFYDTEDFLEHRNAGEFFESAEVYGLWYGVPKHSVVHALERGQDVIVKVDVQGAASIRKLASNGVFIFVAPESRDELLQRLKHRKTEDPDKLFRRFAKAEQELQEVYDFDYVVFNEHDDSGVSPKAVEHISSIIRSERLRVDQHPVTLHRQAN